ncbi:MAG TPA: hypothetical protein VGE12_15145 [Noviherbaspirillum sp.]
MHTLIIKDLVKTEELDSKEMAAVSGGTGKLTMPGHYYGPFAEISKNDYSFDASQALGQTQQTMVNNGNNVAFSDCITASVNPHQNGKNSINVGY